MNLVDSFSFSFDLIWTISQLLAKSQNPYFTSTTADISTKISSKLNLSFSFYLTTITEIHKFRLVNLFDNAVIKIFFI
jgi:hypothetical protein